MASLNEIYSKIDQELKSSNRTGLMKILVENALKTKRVQADRIKSILEIEKYRLVFIGTVGAGKTTAICHLFNLLGEFDTIKTVQRKNETKKVKRTETRELLTTGSGYTTICEVEVKSTDEELPYFEVFFQPKSEIVKKIEDFCEVVDRKKNPQKYTKDEETSISVLSTETERALRNIIKLKRTETSDDAEKLLAECDNDIEKFKNKIISELDIIEDLKTEKRFEKETDDKLFEDNNNQIIKKWIKDTLKDISNVRIIGFSIPNKIILHLPKIYFSNSYLDNFHSIVDTNGIDENIFRVDLENYLNDEQSICVFTSNFLNAPDNNVLPILENSLKNDIFNRHQKFIHLILPRNNEVENYFDAEGSWEKGIIQKKRNIETDFTKKLIRFKKENILFFDVFRYYKEQNPIKEYLEDINKDKEIIFDQIFKIISYRKKLTNEIEKLYNDVMTITKIYDVNIENQLNNILLNINQFRFLKTSINFSYEFARFYRQNFDIETKHAIHRRFGIYVVRDINLFYSFSSIAKDLINDTLFSYRENLKNIFIEFIEFPELKQIFENEIILLIENLYHNFVQQITNKIVHKLETLLNNEFWEDLISINGELDYNGQISNKFLTQLEPINNEINQNIEKLWQQNVIFELLKYISGNSNLIFNETTYISDIEIKNYFSLENIEVSNLSDKKEIYFLGENGDGKTILLQAISLALKGNQLHSEVVEILGQNRNLNYVLKIRDESRFVYNFHSKIKNSHNNLYGYGINRFRYANNEDDEKKDVYVSLFSHEKSYMRNPIDWLLKLRLREYIYKEQNIVKAFNINTVAELIGYWLDKEIEIKVTDKEVTFTEKGYEPLYFSQIADGYKSIVVWLCDLLSRLDENQPDCKSIEEYKGIVLVDEIGVYIHPRLQYTLVRKLREKFDGIQFIFTTHGPIVSLGASPDAVFYKLYKENGKTQISEPIPTESIIQMTLNSLITSTLWRLPSCSNKDVNIQDISDDDYPYKLIHDKIEKEIAEKPNIIEDDLWNLIEQELSTIKPVVKDATIK